MLGLVDFLANVEVLLCLSYKRSRLINLLHPRIILDVFLYIAKLIFKENVWAKRIIPNSFHLYNSHFIKLEFLTYLDIKKAIHVNFMLRLSPGR